MTAPTLPTAAEVILGPEELFFSTTDRRGVIRQGNTVFARVSGYTNDKLLGSPHNIVRHPAMPAGVFRLLWDRLDEGDTVATYVCNQTEDGRPYWVCAVVSPAQDGFLSVRMSPLTPGLEIAREVYGHALAVEQEAAAAGATRREVAVAGRRAIEEALSARGFASYAQFQQAFLPAEMGSRSSVAVTLHQRPGAGGGIGTVLTSTRDVATALHGLVHGLSTYQRLGSELSATADRVLRTVHQLERSVEAAREASDLVAAEVPVLANVANVMATPMGSAVGQLHLLPQAFTHLQASIQSLRLQIGLAALYNDAVADFAAEVWDGEAPAESLSAVPLLVEVADLCVLQMADQVQQVNADLVRVATLVRDSNAHLEDFRRMIGRWRQLVMRHCATTLSHRVAPVDEAITATWSAAEGLGRLGDQMASAILPFDASGVRAHLARMREGAALG